MAEADAKTGAAPAEGQGEGPAAPVTARAAFEAWVSGRSPGADVDVAWAAWVAGMSYLADVVEPAAWVLEWGSISLPKGHPSRITCLTAHSTRDEAIRQGEACDFDWMVYPAYQVDRGEPTGDAAEVA